MFAKAAAVNPDYVIFKIERGLGEGQPEVPPPSLPADQWTTWTWAQYQAEAVACAKSYLALGMDQNSSMSSYGFQAPEMLIAAAGCFLSGI